MDGGKPVLGPRRLGARLLPQVSESPARLHRSLVERRRLVQGRRPLRRGSLKRLEADGTSAKLQSLEMPG
jgi:hypothetical protein